MTLFKRIIIFIILKLIKYFLILAITIITTILKIINNKNKTTTFEI